MLRGMVWMAAATMLASTVAGQFGGGFGGGYGQARGKRVRLADVKAITLKQGHRTTGRRSAGVAQLSCLAGGGAHEPSTVQCVNTGSDGVDAQWECKGDLPNEWRFGDTAVTCEGYDYPEDPFVLQGSCGLEYTLERVPGTHDSYSGGHGGGGGSRYASDTGYGRAGSAGYSARYSGGRSSGGSWMTMLFAVAVCYWLYKWAVGDDGVDRGGANRPPPPPYRAGAPQNGNNAGDWGGGGGGWFGGGRGGGGWFGGRPTYNAYNTGAGNPGFWSGLMAGGMLNSVFGGGRGNGYNQGYGGGGGGWFGRGYGGGGGGYGTGYGAGYNAYPTQQRGSWFGGGGGGARRHAPHHTAHRPATTGSRTATAFATTNRR
eukprot:m.86727 g.86727  ORF g.86727 m.86727 type:complete len:372 (-) comp19861_c0_seq2:144-1259(-)